MTTKKEVAIIGAGLSGLCMAIKLKHNGYSAREVVVLEKSSSVGGTW
jgi:cation diffusion facilitator CzcD-associated flavoprotein CzcO